jgi:RimJ/RimL family protein N-acetyltransferase
MTEARPLLRREGHSRRGRAYLIRPTTTDDLHELVAIVDAAAAEGDLVAAVPGDRTVTEDSLMLSGLLAQGGLSLTLEVDGVVAGRVTIWRHRGRYDGHIGELAIVIAAECRGQGLGRALIEVAVDWGRAVGLRKISLGVFPSNSRAIAVYRAMGFVDEGLQRRQLRLGDVDHDVALMALLLD